MNINKILFIASLLGILMCFVLLSDYNQITISGKITEITYRENIANIVLDNNISLTIFTTKFLAFKQGNNITSIAHKEEYRGRTQYIVEKIIKH